MLAVPDFLAGFSYQLSRRCTKKAFEQGTIRPLWNDCVFIAFRPASDACCVARGPCVSFLAEHLRLCGDEEFWWAARCSPVVTAMKPHYHQPSDGASRVAFPSVIAPAYNRTRVCFLARTLFLIPLSARMTILMSDASGDHFIYINFGGLIRVPMSLPWSVPK